MMRGFVEIILTGVAFIAALIGLTVGLAIAMAYWEASNTCSAIDRTMALETDVSIGAGCLVKYRGEWMTAQAALNNTHRIEPK